MPRRGGKIVEFIGVAVEIEQLIGVGLGHYEFPPALADHIDGCDSAFGEVLAYRHGLGAFKTALEKRVEASSIGSPGEAGFA